MNDILKKPSNKHILAMGIVVISIVLLVFVTGCIQNKTDAIGTAVKTDLQNLSQAPNITIKANVNKDCAGTPWYVGMQKGFFVASGIDSQDQGHLDWSLQPTALISGQTNVVDGHPNTITNLL